MLVGLMPQLNAQHGSNSCNSFSQVITDLLEKIILQRRRDAVAAAVSWDNEREEKFVKYPCLFDVSSSESKTSVSEK